MALSATITLDAFTPEQLATLRLIRTDGVGPVTFHNLINTYGSAQKAIENAHGWQKKPTLCAADALQDELDAMNALGATYVFYFESAYPKTLGHLTDPPPVLCVQGNVELLQQPAVAIVGSRNASALGRRFSRTLAADLTKEGYAIISGLARGIDTAAHEGALSAGGATIGVLGGGLDYMYPPENEPLYKQLAQKGLLIAETPCGSPPTAASFPRRNRLVAALSKAVVVTEAAKKSGSLITARLAAELGREVLAVPGHPSDPRAGGPNYLLKHGAGLLEDARDVLHAIKPHGHKVRDDEPELPLEENTQEATPESKEDIIYSLLHSQGVDIDELVSQSGLDIQTVNTLLSELELDGKIERLTGNKIAKVS